MSNLAQGTYTVTMSDASGCTAETLVTLSDPPELIAEAIVSSDHNGTQVSCPGAIDGEITATGSGGIGIHTYEWSTGDNGSVLSNVGAGDYSVTITDEFGCEETCLLYTSPSPRDS